MMYPFPSDFDCQAFAGRKLEMLCLTANQINLHFEEKISIGVEGAFAHRRASDEAVSKISVPLANTAIVSLLERCVIEAFLPDEQSLVLRFDNGDSLYFIDETPNYESFHFSFGDKTIII